MKKINVRTRKNILENTRMICAVNKFKNNESKLNRIRISYYLKQFLTGIKKEVR